MVVTLMRNISDLTNLSTSDIVGEIFVVRQLLNHITSGDILVEDPFARSIISDPRNQFAYEKLLEVMCRLGVFRPGQIAEIHSCLDSGDSLLPKNAKGADTTGDKEVKSTNTLSYIGKGKYRYPVFTVGHLRKKHAKIIHVIITYGGRRQEAFIPRELINSNRISIPADKDGTVRRETKWGKYFYKD